MIGRHRHAAAVAGGRRPLHPATAWQVPFPRRRPPGRGGPSRRRFSLLRIAQCRRPISAKKTPLDGTLAWRAEESGTGEMGESAARRPARGSLPELNAVQSAASAREEPVKPAATAPVRRTLYRQSNRRPYWLLRIALAVRRTCGRGARCLRRLVRFREALRPADVASVAAASRSVVRGIDRPRARASGRAPAPRRPPSLLRRNSPTPAPRRRERAGPPPRRPRRRRAVRRRPLRTSTISVVSRNRRQRRTSSVTTSTSSSSRLRAR